MSAAKKVYVNSILDSHDILDKLQKDEKGFLKLAEILRNHAGINMVLNDKNLTLMASRLNSVMKKLNANNYKEYIKMLEEPKSIHMTDFIVSLTTNTTQFFREPIHFEVLAQKLPEILARKEKQKNNEIRIWCSATSTGQEVYTIMMTVLNYIGTNSRWNIKFLATDIDHEVLQKASNGIYQDNEMQGVPNENMKYFQGVKSQGDDSQLYQFKPELISNVRFATFNLLTEKYPFQFPFDIIFCRNVLIYFDRPTAEVVIEKQAKTLTPGGFLFLGHSETGMMKSKILKTITNGVYTRID